MAKTLSTTKDNLKALLDVTDRIPPDKLGNAKKHVRFRKVLKKHLKDYLADLLVVRKEVKEKELILQKESKPPSPSTPPIEDKGPDEEMLKKRKEFTDYVEGQEKIMDEKLKELQLVKVEAVFDNEDFLFEEDIITSNAPLIFKFKTVSGVDKFDADAYEVILDIFDSVK